MRSLAATRSASVMDFPRSYTARVSKDPNVPNVPNVPNAPNDKRAPAASKPSPDESGSAFTTGTLVAGDVSLRFAERGSLGVGGMSKVIRAFDRSLLRDVAVKVLDPRHAADAITRRSFLEEA